MGKTHISFDFDGTLGHVPYIQNLCKCLLIDKHNEVFIITRRFNYVHPEYGDEMTQVFAVAEKLGIPRANVIFTNREYKVNTLKKHQIDIHYDDDATEIMHIRQLFPQCKGFLVFI